MGQVRMHEVRLLFKNFEFFFVLKKGRFVRRSVYTHVDAQKK